MWRKNILVVRVNSSFFQCVVQWKTFLDFASNFCEINFLIDKSKKKESFHETFDSPLQTQRNFLLIKWPSTSSEINRYQVPKAMEVNFVTKMPRWTTSFSIQVVSRYWDLSRAAVQDIPLFLENMGTFAKTWLGNKDDWVVLKISWKRFSCGRFLNVFVSTSPKVLQFH